MTQSEIEHMWKVASNNPNHDTNWHDPVVVSFAKMVAARERESVVEDFTKFMIEVDQTPRTASTKFVSALTHVIGDKFFELIRARGQA
jgi:hypothetical protein